MKQIYLALLLLLTSIAAMAQSTLKGIISSKENNEKLVGATIYCADLNRATISDANGNYELTLRKGTYKIQVSYLGYQTLFETVTIQEAATTQDFGLDKSSIEVNEVVISGASARLQDESPQEIDVVKTTDVQMGGGVTVMDALSKIPGVWQIGTGSFTSRPVIRGLYGNRVLTVADGVRLENQQWDDEHALGLSETGYDRIEVIKGPASLLYGPEAMGGALHFIEEEPAPAGHIVGDASVNAHSNILGFGGQAGVKGATDKYFWGVRGGGISFSDYHSGHSDRVANSRFGGGNGKLTVGTTRNWGSTAFSYQFNSMFYGVIEPIDTLEKKRGGATEDFPREAEAPYHEVLYNKLVSKTNIILGATLLKITLGYQNDRRAEYEPDTLDVANKLGYAYLDMLLQSYTYDVKWQIPLGARLINTIGTQGMMQTNENFGAKRLVPNGTVNDATGFLVSKLNLHPVSIEGGLRYDTRNIASEEFGVTGKPEYMGALNRGFNNLSGSIGATFDLLDVLLMRANYGTGYRAPNMVELLSNGFKPETQRYEMGNSNFKTEQNREIDLSATLRFESLSLEGAIYQNKFNNYIYLSPSGSSTSVVMNGAIITVPLYNYLQANATFHGGEGGVILHPKGAQWLRIQSTFSTVNATLDAGGYLPFIPAKRIQSSITFLFKEWKVVKKPFVTIGMVNVLEQKRFANYEVATDGYNLLNFAVGGTCHYKTLPIEWALTANNLLDTKYIDHLNRLRPYAMGGNVANTVGHDFNVYNQGLNVALSLRVPFSIK